MGNRLLMECSSAHTVQGPARVRRRANLPGPQHVPVMTGDQWRKFNGREFIRLLAADEHRAPMAACRNL